MRKHWAILLMAAMALASCKRMPLYDMARNLRLELLLQLDLAVELDPDIHTDITVERSIRPPEHHKVLFYSSSSGILRHTEFVGPMGGYLSVPAGDYQMVAYSFGTEYTLIRNESSMATIEAFTTDITATKAATLRGFTHSGEDKPQGPIVYALDHLLVTREQAQIPEWTDAEQVVTLHAVAKTIVETYTFEARSIVGVQYIEHCEAFISNQARSSFVGRGEVSREPATLSFPVGIDRQQGCLYTTFNTFGKLPGESRCYLYILIRDAGGKEHHVTADITDQFEKPDHHIVIDEDIVIPQPDANGGIAPSVTPWDEENHDVPIG